MDGRHQLRLKGKTLRYAIEDLSPLFPDQPRRAQDILEAAKTVQDVLGALNDRAVRQRLVDLAAHGDPDLARAAARVVLDSDETDLLRAAHHALEDLLRAKTFW